MKVTFAHLFALAAVASSTLALPNNGAADVVDKRGNHYHPHHPSHPYNTCPVTKQTYEACHTVYCSKKPKHRHVPTSTAYYTTHYPKTTVTVTGGATTTTTGTVSQATTTVIATQTTATTTSVTATVTVTTATTTTVAPTTTVQPNTFVPLGQQLVSQGKSGVSTTSSNVKRSLQTPAAAAALEARHKKYVKSVQCDDTVAYRTTCTVTATATPLRKRALVTSTSTVTSTATTTVTTVTVTQTSTSTQLSGPTVTQYPACMTNANYVTQVGGQAILNAFNGNPFQNTFTSATSAEQCCQMCQRGGMNDQGTLCAAFTYLTGGQTENCQLIPQGGTCPATYTLQTQPIVSGNAVIVAGNGNCGVANVVAAST